MSTPIQGMISDLETYGSVKFWAEWFDVQPDTLKKWVTEYAIPHRRLKTLWLIRARDIIEYAEEFYGKEETRE